MLPTNSLEALGATPEVNSAFAPHRDQGLSLARVSLVIRDEYRLLAPAGELHAEAAGVLFHMATRQADLPAVGDWVAVRIIGGGEALIQAVLPRRSCFSRRAAGRREDEQVIAANIDTVFLVTGLDGDFNLRRVERYLTLIHESGAEPVIVLNKIDLCDNVPEHIRLIREIAPAVPVAAIRANSEEGIAPILVHIRSGRTVSLIGSSGVGKSTLLNQLLGRHRQRTGGVREDDNRGRHTTTHRELIVLPAGGVLIDNPGMRELQLWAGHESLDETFAEIAALSAACRFPDCRHESEPDCAVLAALAEGSLQAARWESYLKLRAEIRHHQIRADRNAASAEKQRWKVIHKSMRHFKKHY